MNIQNPTDDEMDMVKEWMLYNYEYCMQWSSFTLNCTKLAEMAADEYNIYEDEIEYNIPDWVYDLAIDAEHELIDDGKCQL